MSDTARQIVIKDARHAHTAAMRLDNFADLFMQETELSMEFRQEVAAGVRAYATQIRAVVQEGE